MCHNVLYILTILILLTASRSQAATYTWYFSDDAAGNAAGNDTTGDGSEGTPWKSLSKAQAMLASLQTGDTATLKFDRGDTWNDIKPNWNLVTGVQTIPPAFKTGRDGVLWIKSGITVTIDAYGSTSLSKPIFDGGETWLSNPWASGKDKADSIIHLQSASNVTIRNIIFQYWYSTAISPRGTHSNILVEDCEAYYMGQGLFVTDDVAGASYTNMVIQDNIVDHFEQNNVLYLTGITPTNPYWGGAIHLQGSSASGLYSEVINCTIRRNRISYGAGEGIIMGSYYGSTNIVEDNIVSNTGHIAFHVPCTSANAGGIILRRNLAYWTNKDDLPSYYESTGIYIYDEAESAKLGDDGDGNPNTNWGDNSSAKYSIYQNVIINALYGIWIMPTEDAWGEIQIFNNTIIDCDYTLRLGGYVSVTNMDIFDNSFLYLGKTGSHILINSAPSGWTWGPNHWYGGTLPGSPYYVP